MTDEWGRAGEHLQRIGELVRARDEAVDRAEKAERDLARLTSLVQMCCDGSSEDDPAVLCARRVSDLIAQRDEAELQLLFIWKAEPVAIAGSEKYIEGLEKRHQGVDVLAAIAELSEHREELE
jgi:hypothetical protein